MNIPPQSDKQSVFVSENKNLQNNVEQEEDFADIIRDRLNNGESLEEICNTINLGEVLLVHAEASGSIQGYTLSGSIRFEIVRDSLGHCTVNQNNITVTVPGISVNNKSNIANRIFTARNLNQGGSVIVEGSAYNQTSRVEADITNISIFIGRLTNATTIRSEGHGFVITRRGGSQVITIPPDMLPGTQSPNATLQPQETEVPRIENTGEVMTLESGQSYTLSAGQVFQIPDRFGVAKFQLFSIPGPGDKIIYIVGEEQPAESGRWQYRLEGSVATFFGNSNNFDTSTGRLTIPSDSIEVEIPTQVDLNSENITNVPNNIDFSFTLPVKGYQIINFQGNKYIVSVNGEGDGVWIQYIDPTGRVRSPDDEDILVELANVRMETTVGNDGQITIHNRR